MPRPLSLGGLLTTLSSRCGRSGASWLPSSVTGAMQLPLPGRPALEPQAATRQRDSHRSVRKPKPHGEAWGGCSSQRPSHAQGRRERSSLR